MTSSPSLSVDADNTSPSQSDTPPSPDMTASAQSQQPEKQLQHATNSLSPHSSRKSGLPRSRSPTPINAGRLLRQNEIREEELWDVYCAHRAAASVDDAFEYARKRRDAVRKYSLGKPLWPLDFWIWEASAALKGGRRYVATLTEERLEQILASGRRPQILGIGGLQSFVPCWYLADAWPEADVTGFRPGFLWPNNIKRATVATGPINFRSIIDPKTTSTNFKLPFSDDTFDYINSESLMYHFGVDMVDKVAAELNRVLKPGGIVELQALDSASMGCSEDYSMTLSISRYFPNFTERDCKWNASLHERGLEINQCRLTIPCLNDTVSCIGELVFRSERMRMWTFMHSIHGCNDSALLRGIMHVPDEPRMLRIVAQKKFEQDEELHSVF